MAEPEPQSLIRFLLRSMCDGIAVGWALLLAILWSDVGGVGTLAQNSPLGEMAVAMLAVVFAITFGSVGMGVAIFLESDDGPPQP